MNSEVSKSTTDMKEQTVVSFHSLTFPLCVCLSLSYTQTQRPVQFTNIINCIATTRVGEKYNKFHNLHFTHIQIQGEFRNEINSSEANVQNVSSWSVPSVPTAQSTTTYET